MEETGAPTPVFWYYGFDPLGRTYFLSLSQPLLPLRLVCNEGRIELPLGDCLQSDASLSRKSNGSMLDH